MVIENVYPSVNKRKVRMDIALMIIRLMLIISALASLIVNFLVGGKAWSIVVLVAIYMSWILFVSPDLIERNRISLFTKLITSSCLLLISIEMFLASGWALLVVPIVGGAGLVISAVLFFTDFERQKQNMRPMLVLIFISLIVSGLGLYVWREQNKLTLFIMGTIAFLLLIVYVIILGGDFIRELKRRFHIK